jgi:hypothetical protein
MTNKKDKGPEKNQTVAGDTGAKDPQQKPAPKDVKDGEKMIIKPEERKSFNEQDSDGSANAFDGK